MQKVNAYAIVEVMKEIRTGASEEGASLPNVHEPSESFAQPTEHAQAQTYGHLHEHALRGIPVVDPATRSAARAVIVHNALSGVLGNLVDFLPTDNANEQVF